MLSIRRSFSAKVIFWVMLLAVPVFFASVGVLFWQSRKIVRTESVERANGALASTLQHMNRYLVTAETAANVNAWQAEETMTPETLQAITRRLVLLNPYVDGCAISTEPGVIQSCPQGFMALTIRKGDTVQSSIRTDSDYLRRRNEEGRITAYSRPLHDARGRLVGMLSTELSLLHISKILAEERPYPNSYFVMVDEQGRFVGHPDSTRLFRQTIFSVTDPEKQADIIALGYEMTKGRQGSMSVMVNGSPSMVCYMPVTGTTWSLAIVCPDSDVLRDYHQLTYIVLTLLAIGLLLIFINCHKAVTVSLRPLRELLVKTQAVAQGNLEVEIAHTRRTDVIGGLQNSFATMLQSLNYYMDSVRTATQQTRRYNRELERATRLVLEAERQKTTFIQNVSHQIRTPLNIIVGFAQVLSNPSGRVALREAMTEEDIKGMAATMDHNCKVLIRMVLMLFDSSDTGRAQSVKWNKREMVGCNEACREARDFIVQLNRKPISFETCVPDSFSILTNRRYLVYSLQEVLGNATRHSDGLHVLLRVERDDRSVRFIIQDTGKGIAEGDLDRIFKFFTKVDDFSEGLGLGLPLTKRHAEDLGGSFTLDTNYRQGCRFILELPVQQVRQPASPTALHLKCQPGR